MQEQSAGTTPGEVVGHAPPEEGVSEAPASEIPVGVDALDPEQIDAAQAASAESGDDGAIDVAAIVEEGAADETGEDAAVKTDADAQVAPDTGDA